MQNIGTVSYWESVSHFLNRFLGRMCSVSWSRTINYCYSCILLRQNLKVLFRLSRTELGLTANNFEDSIACTTSREIYDSRTQVTRPHQATKPSWRMGWIIETPRVSERERESVRLSAFLSSKKGVQVDAVSSWRTLNDDAWPYNSRRSYSKLTGDSARLREVSCWIVLGI